MRYLNTFFNLISGIAGSHYPFFIKVLKILLILISSNRFTSFLFGFPFVLLFIFFGHNNKIFDFLIKNSLLHIALKSISKNLFCKIRANFNYNNNYLLINEDFISKGFLKLNSTLSVNVVDNVTKLLDDSPCFSAQVPSQGLMGTKEQLFKSSKFISYDITNPDVYKAVTLIFEQINFNNLISFLGLKKVKIYSVNLYWNIYLNNMKIHAVQKYHRDYDGFNCYVIFVALSKTSASNGATEVLSINGESYFLEANKGELYFFDPYFIHRANPITLSDRLTCWIRVGEVPNLAYHQDLNFLEPKKSIYNELNKRFLNTLE